MKNFIVKFQENGEEYTGYLNITANKVEQLNKNTFLADNVEITIDEPIISIQETKEK